MERNRRVLDIGIGAGGEYIKKDPASTLRVGIDNEWIFLHEARRRGHTLPLVEGDGSLLDTNNLPFKDNSFDKIDILFPNGSMLFSLTENPNLWKDFERVLKKENEGIEIVLKIPFTGTRTFHMGRGGVRTIYRPESRIIHKAQENGFVVNLKRLEPEEVEQYGSEFSSFAAGEQKSFLSTSVFKINCNPDNK